MCINGLISRYEFLVSVGSRSAPVRTPRYAHLRKVIRVLRPVEQGSHFCAEPHAGLDFAIELARQIRGEEAPRLFELVLEYDPKPPFAAGTPELAGATLTERVRQIRGPALPPRKRQPCAPRSV